MRHAGIHQATLLKLAASRLMTPRDVLAQPPMDLMEMLDQSMPAGGIRAVLVQSRLLSIAARLMLTRQANRCHHCTQSVPRSLTPNSYGLRMAMHISAKPASQSAFAAHGV